MIYVLNCIYGMFDYYLFVFIYIFLGGEIDVGIILLRDSYRNLYLLAYIYTYITILKIVS